MPMSVSAVFMSSDLTSPTEGPGCGRKSSAAEPVTIGAAPEVPPKAVSAVPVPASVETEAPGAPMSGLIATKLWLGPRRTTPDHVARPRLAAPAGSIVAGAPNALVAAGFGHVALEHVVPSATPLR